MLLQAPAPRGNDGAAARELVVARQLFLNAHQANLENRIRGDLGIRKHFTIIGSGSVGAKAEERAVKSEAIMAAGFQENRVFVLSMDLCRAFCSRNKVFETDDPKEQQMRILEGRFSLEEFTVIDKISKKLRGRPSIARSSAYRDSLGTGTYESIFVVEPGPSELKAAIKKVLASQFSEDAIAYRRVNGLPEGMAVIIEPVVGKEMELKASGSLQPMKCFAPFLSGFGLTSTPGGEGFIKMVGGLPTSAVHERRGVRIARSDLKYGNSLGLIKASLIVDPLALRPSTSEWGFVSRDVICLEDWPYAEKFKHVGRGDVATVRYESLRGPLEDADFPVRGMFNAMGKLEKACGCPQYFEWAAVKGENGWSIHILQLGDFTGKEDVQFPKEPAPLLCESTIAYATGKAECKGLVHVWDKAGLSALPRFNESNSNYVVAYSASLNMGAGKNVRFALVSNSAVIIEVQDKRHVDDPVAHWAGQLRSSGKLFFLVKELNGFELDESLVTEHGPGYAVYGNVRIDVTASEVQQRAIVELPHLKDRVLLSDEESLAELVRDLKKREEK